MTRSQTKTSQTSRAPDQKPTPEQRPAPRQEGTRDRFLWSRRGKLTQNSTLLRSIPDNNVWNRMHTLPHVASASQHAWRGAASLLGVSRAGASCQGQRPPLHLLPPERGLCLLDKGCRGTEESGCMINICVRYVAL